MLERLIAKGFEVRVLSHAAAILLGDFPEAAQEIEAVLLEVEVPITEVIGSGGGETKGTRRMRDAFTNRGWTWKQYEITKTINGLPRESVSHKVDHVKQFARGEIALELEWNNKDPFFDRDLENFRRLHNEGAISLGVIVTRGTTLQERMPEFVLRFGMENGINSFDDLDRLGIELTATKKKAIKKRTERLNSPISFTVAWRDNFISNKYGASQTYWRKLTDRVDRGVGNPCPLLLVGIPDSVISFGSNTPEQIAKAIEIAAEENSETSATEE